MTARMEQSVLAFNAAVTAFAKRTQADAVTLQRALSLQILSGVVLKTPVDTGRARGNWQLNVSQTANPNSDVKGVDKNGGETINRGAKKLDGLKFGRLVVIFNNVEYVPYLNNGTSRQAGKYFVERTIDEVTSQLT